MVMSEDVGVKKRFKECEKLDGMVKLSSETGSDFTSSVTLRLTIVREEIVKK